jgi:plastocyanin
MTLKRTALLIALALGLATAGAATAATPSNHASIVIRHQTHGCHAWSVNGGAFKASQSVTLRRGASLTVTNTDVMPHTLLQASGPALRIAHAKLGHMGASLTLSFAHPGVYRFTTKPGEDYMAGVKTTGADNVLLLTVVVS